MGAPGTGKTVFQPQIIARILERGDPAVIYDLKGDFVAKFYKPGRDHLFNPMDTRCFPWTIFNDIHYDHDIDAVAGSVIPEDGKDPFWNKAASSLFGAIIRTCVYHGRTTNKDLDTMMRMPLAELAELFKATKKPVHTGHRNRRKRGYLNLYFVPFERGRQNFLGVIFGLTSAKKTDAH